MAVGLQEARTRDLRAENDVDFVANVNLWKVYRPSFVAINDPIREDRAGAGFTKDVSGLTRFVSSKLFFGMILATRFNGLFFQDDQTLAPA